MRKTLQVILRKRKENIQYSSVHSFVSVSIVIETSFGVLLKLIFCYGLDFIRKKCKNKKEIHEFPKFIFKIIAN